MDYPWWRLHATLCRLLHATLQSFEKSPVNMRSIFPVLIQLIWPAHLADWLELYRRGEHPKIKPDAMVNMAAKRTAIVAGGARRKTV